MGFSLVKIIKAIMIGIVEGITEWLPISSTGHMLLLNDIFPLNMDKGFENMFFVVIQLGAILAVVVMFWKKMWPFHKENGVMIADKDICKMWLKVIAACLPAGILGLLFNSYLENHFYTPQVIATMLIVYGVAFIVVECWNKRRKPKMETVSNMGYLTAIFIGLFQALSMIPGTSRSGATIIGALILGVSRTAAAEFTFFLAVPTMIGASCYKLLKFGLAFTPEQAIVLIVGMVVAFLVSLVVIKFLMSYIKKHDFKVFGWYRIVLGIIVIACCVLNLN